MTNEADRAFLKDILESRENLRDRFNFETAVSPAKAGDPVFQRRQRLSREAAAYWIPRLRGGRQRQVTVPLCYPSNSGDPQHSLSRLLDANRIAPGLGRTIPVRSETSARRALLKVWKINHHKGEDAHDDHGGKG